MHACEPRWLISVCSHLTLLPWAKCLPSASGSTFCWKFWFHSTVRRQFMLTALHSLRLVLADLLSLNDYRLRHLVLNWDSSSFNIFTRSSNFPANVDNILHRYWKGEGGALSLQSGKLQRADPLPEVLSPKMLHFPIFCTDISILKNLQKVLFGLVWIARALNLSHVKHV